MRRILMVLTVCVATAPALAQETVPDTEGGQYILRRVDGGLMRVDRETGMTSFCRKRDAAWVCEVVADDRVALEEEIERLSSDNSKLAIEIGRLKDRIDMLEARLEETPQAGPEAGDPKAGDPKAGDDQSAFDFPSDEEMDQVMKSFESMMHRFLDMMRDLREEYDPDKT
ncbi:hypothetical protein [Microbaculum marinum]|uniref:Uncharacterized protein n=1 Tax=Microbaculum marinum TaxID=1764581 RepID=A0AAW9RNK3_9HYPH